MGEEVMQTRDIAFLVLGSFSFLLGSILSSNFNFADSSALDAFLTFSVSFFLVFMASILWVAATINIIKEL